MRYFNRLLTAALLWLALLAPALAQSVVPVQMRDANLTTTITQNFISTQNTFSAPRTLTIPDRSSINSYYLQFIDTANAVNGANTLTIQSSGGNLINGSATYVISQPGAYVFLTPNGSGYKATAFFNQVAPSAPGGSNTQVQYNNAGVFGGISGATSNGTAITLVAPVLGTPASGNLANTTGYALANLTGAATGCLTWLGTATSANLRGCLTDETGTGLAYFQGGDIGTPSAGVGSNLTALNATQLTTGTVPGARLATATKADQQAGSSTTLVVTPSQQQSHDSAVKAWATWTASTGAILSSYNVTSVVRGAAGTYTVTFTTPFASANYVCDVNVVSSSVLISQTTPAVSASAIGAFTANTSGVGTDATSTASIVCFGRQ